MAPSMLTAEQRADVAKHFKVCRNEGTVGTGLWVYQPHDFDGSFELWSDTYKTRRAAEAAAYAELTDPTNDIHYPEAV